MLKEEEISVARFLPISSSFASISEADLLLAIGDVDCVVPILLIVKG